MQNRKYGIPDCVSECENLTTTEAVERLGEIKEQLRQDWNSCKPENLPEVDMVLEFVEMAIHHISSGDRDFCTDYPNLDELVYLCDSVIST